MTFSKSFETINVNFLFLDINVLLEVVILLSVVRLKPILGVQKNFLL